MLKFESYEIKKCDSFYCTHSASRTVNLRGKLYYLCAECATREGLESAARDSDAILMALHVLREIDKSLELCISQALSIQEAIEMLENYNEKTMGES